MATETNKVTYTDEQKQAGRKLFADLRALGSKDGKPASPNMKMAFAIALMNDCKDSLVQYRQYDELSKVDNVINAIKNYKVAEQERITAIIEAKNNEATA